MAVTSWTKSSLTSYLTSCLSLGFPEIFLWCSLQQNSEWTNSGTWSWWWVLVEWAHWLTSDLCWIRIKETGGYGESKRSTPCQLLTHEGSIGSHCLSYNVFSKGWYGSALSCLLLFAQSWETTGLRMDLGEFLSKFKPVLAIFTYSLFSGLKFQEIAYLESYGYLDGKLWSQIKLF